MGINNKLSKVQSLDQYGIWVKTSVDTLDADIALDSEEIPGKKQEISLAHDQYDEASEKSASHILPDFPDTSDFPDFSDEDSPDIVDTSSDFSTDDISDSDIFVESFPGDDIFDSDIPVESFPGDDISDSGIPVENFPGDDISDSDILVENSPGDDTFLETSPVDETSLEDNFPGDGVFLKDSPVKPLPEEDLPEDDTFFLRDSPVDEISMEDDFGENDILLEESPADEISEDSSIKEVHLEEDFPENDIILRDIPAEDTPRDTDSDRFHKFENEYASLNNEIHTFRDQLLKEVSQIKQQIVELQNDRYSRSVEDSAAQEKSNGFFAESPDDEIISLTDQELDIILETHEEEEYLSNEPSTDMMPHNEEEADDSSGKDTVSIDTIPEIDEKLLDADSLSEDDVLDMDEYETRIASLETGEQDDSTDSSLALSQMKLGDDGAVFKDIEEISLDDIMQYASEANVSLENSEDTQDSDMLSEYSLENELNETTNILDSIDKDFPRDPDTIENELKETTNILDAMDKDFPRNSDILSEDSFENELNETASILDNMDKDFSRKTELTENTDDEIVISLRDDNDAPSKSNTTEDMDMDSLDSIFEPWEVVENNGETQNDITDIKNIKDTPSLNLPDIDDDISPPGTGSHSPVTVPSSVPQDDFKSTLQYIDGLLDLLPHGKYQEFVHSEHFSMYKKILEELGIAS